MVVMQAIFKEGVAASYMFKAGQEPQSTLRTSVRTFIDKINARIRESNAVELVIPGRILHLKHMEDSSNPPYATLPVRSPTSYQLQQQLEPETIRSSSNSNSTSNCCSTKNTYIAVESTFENFKEIEVSPSMGYEHFPNQYVNAINDMYEEMMNTGFHSTYNKNF
jgi:hypothetical protein